MTATILNFVRSPSNTKEAYDLAEWMRQCMAVYFLGCEIGFGICVHNMRALADAFNGRGR